MKPHEKQYADAWDEYCKGPTSRALELEGIMDQAQNHFTLDEFQEFKKTLPGYLEFWNALSAAAANAASNIPEKTAANLASDSVSLETDTSNAKK